MVIFSSVFFNTLLKSHVYFEALRVKILGRISMLRLQCIVVLYLSFTPNYAWSWNLLDMTNTFCIRNAFGRHSCISTSSLGVLQSHNTKTIHHETLAAPMLCSSDIRRTGRLLKQDYWPSENIVHGRCSRRISNHSQNYALAIECCWNN